MATTRSLIRAFLLIGFALPYLTLGEFTPPLEDCDINIGKSTTEGGSFGLPFCAMQIKQGHFVSGLKIWFGDRIDAIQIKYDNGDTTTIGDTNGSDQSGEIDWDASTVSIKSARTCATIWCRQGQTDLNIDGLYIEFSDGRIIRGGNTLLVTEKTGDFPSGTLLGLSGMYGGNGIEALTFHMLSEKIGSGKVHNVTFSPTAEELNKRHTNEDRGLLYETIWTGHYFNQLSYDYNLVFEEARNFEKSMAWTNTISNTWHLGTSVEIEHEMNTILIKDTLKVTGEFFWEHHKEKSNLKGSKETQAIKYGVNALVKPGKAVKAWASMVSGHWNVDWSGLVTVMVGDKEFTFPIAGTLTNVQYSEAWVHVEEEDAKQLEAAIANDGEQLINENGQRISWDSLGLGRRWIA